MERDEEEIRLVVYTNVLISALLMDESLTAWLLGSDALQLLLSLGRLNRVDYYREYIISKRDKYIQASSFEHALQFVLGSMSIVPSEMYSCRMKEAFSLMKDIDPKDTPFLALALQLESPLWSNDMHFKDLESVLVYSTGSLVEHLRDKGVWWCRQLELAPPGRPATASPSAMAAVLLYLRISPSRKLYDIYGSFRLAKSLYLMRDRTADWN